MEVKFWNQITACVQTAIQSYLPLEIWNFVYQKFRSLKMNSFIIMLPSENFNNDTQTQDTKFVCIFVFVVFLGQYSANEDNDIADSWSSKDLLATVLCQYYFICCMHRVKTNPCAYKSFEYRLPLCRLLVKGFSNLIFKQ